MNRDLIAKWNSKVGNSDLVFHLGDFGFGSHGRLRGIREALNGSVFLIKGNHDSQPSKWLLPILDKWAHSFCLDTPYGKAFLTHVPPQYTDHVGRTGLRVDPVPPDTAFVLHGHTHGAKPTQRDNLWCVDVGVDAMGLVPLTMEEIVQKVTEYEIEVFKVQKEATQQ
jgi:calcineurin-like phosphoesterase family protein